MAVVGAGIVGVALAREITSRFPDAEVTVFDKAERVAAHQSGHTSGVVDPALAAQPGSPEAKLAHRGVELLVPFVSERGIPYRECGQLLVAQNTDEADRLEEILARAEANSIPGVRLLDRKEMREIEPNARGVLALYAPHTAVTDFTALTEALASDVSAAGGTFRFGTEVTGFDVMSNEVRLRMRTAAPESHDGVEDDGDAGGDDAAGSSDSEGRDESSSRDESSERSDIDDQVHEAPRTYRGDNTTGPVIDFRDELRSRFGSQDWFKQVEDTIGSLSDRFTNPTSGSERPAPHERDRPAARERDRPDRAEGTEVFDLVIVCAGLQADRLAAAAGFDEGPRIVPFTSDYYAIDDRATDDSAEVVRGIIGAVPDPSSPFSERSVVRGIRGGLVLGPNTIVSLGRERYDKHGFDLGDMGSTVGFKGFWKFAAQTAKTAARGAKSAVSTSAFVEEIRKFVPAIDASAVRADSRGIRAQAIDAEGTLVDELRVTTRGRLTMVRSLPKSGATSALATAERIANQVFDGPADADD
ncbi:FAD-dependent oxidoreductase [Brevibacterium aurantiacum]|uniref:L-2-hydroxyglutarate oxidase n=1 Tax=Brevibacterium aurantiacum TaxID=273384 RepID=A0A1D7VZD8_BREAU|nr:L-2-hydroxyglutarate oxidase [Brevibacterium aurantiacum]AZL08114.1 FAD-dependent oxidoreductase [Brevibacterium aurantiacum]RCS98689.1 FAD-dependent oxidoreductase [Brevibacterium aurantiacum]